MLCLVTLISLSLIKSLPQLHKNENAYSNSLIMENPPENNNRAAVAALENIELRRTQNIYDL